MEKWQIKHITTHLHELIRKTNSNNALFISKLRYIFSDSDVNLLKAKWRSEGDDAHCMELYERAKTRLDGYGNLIKGLLETNQTGAVKILIDGFLKNSTDSTEPGNVFKASQIFVELGDQVVESIVDNFSHALLHCDVDFQGYALPLGMILKNFDQDIANEVVRQLKGKFLVDLINGCVPTLVGNSTPDPFKYYIPRLMNTRSIIDERVLQKQCRDVFLIQGIELHELSGLTSEGTDLSINQICALTSRFMVLIDEQHFYQICEFTNDPVHWLANSAGKFNWVKSKGDLSIIQEFVHEAQDELEEGEFLELCLKSNNPVCISDTPGMGKTALLASLAHQINLKHPSRLVRFLVLREFVQQAHENGKIEAHILVEMIAEQASGTEVGKTIVRELFKSETPILELMFDGFDEVLGSQVQTAKLILQIFSSLKSVRLWVTTRPHMRDELENSVSSIGSNILAFGKTEQIEFLTKYWEQHGATKCGKLVEFATQCLDKVKANMNNIEEDIAGVPLQCTLLAEVYSKNAVSYSNQEHIGVVINVTSIFEMYTKLMKMRFEMHTTSDKVEFLNNSHIYVALQLLFPEHAETFRFKLIGNNDLDHPLLYSLGIVEEKKTYGNTPRFIHRTFAEYFVSLFVVNLLNEASEIDFVFKNVLSTNKCFEYFLKRSKVGKCDPVESSSFQNPIICYFINAHVKQNPIKSTVSWTNEAARIYNFLLACIHHDYPTLYDLGFNTHERLVTEKYAFRLSHFPLLCAKNSSLQFFQTTYNFVMKNPNTNASVLSTSPEFMVTPLHVAAEVAHYSIFDFLIKLMGGNSENKYLAHCCVAGSVRDNSIDLSYKIQILKNLITSKNKDYVNEIMPDGTTPLLQSDVHVELVRTLLIGGADVTVKNSEGYTPLINGLGFGNGLNVSVIQLMEEKGLEITQQVASEGLRRLFCNRNITPWKVEADFIPVADFLIEKGGVITCGNTSPWDLEATEKNMHNLIQATTCNDALLRELTRRGVFTQQAMDHLEEPEALYKTLSKCGRNSFEQTCLSLISCSQTVPFQLLKACLQSGMQDSVIFLTPPNGVVKLLQSVTEKVIILVSFDTELTVTRLRNTIDPDLLVINSTDLSKFDHSTVTLAVCTATIKDIKVFQDFDHKTICVVKNAIQTENCDFKIIYDEFGWNDLSTGFQNKLISFLNVRAELASSSSKENYLELKNEELVKFINEHSSPNLIDMISDYRDRYLEQTSTSMRSILSEYMITPLHVAVANGHLGITEFLLRLNSQDDLAKIHYLVHYCVAESKSDNEAVISQKLKIISKLLSAFKDRINERLPDGRTPLHQTNVHVRLLECLINAGSDINAVNFEGCTPFVHAICYGKSLDLRVIQLMESKGLKITTELASEALKGLVCNKNIIAGELDSEFVDVADYLMGKGAQIACRNGKSPWNLEPTVRNLHRVAQFTNCHETFLKELKFRGVIVQQNLNSFVDEPESLYEHVQASTGTFERVCVSLIACQQIKPFVLLKQFLQTDNNIQDSVKFVTGTESLLEVLQMKNQKVVVLRSFDFELSLTRIKETIDPDVRLIEDINENKNAGVLKSPLIVYQCETATKELVENLDAATRKCIFLCYRVSEDVKSCKQLYTTLNDDVCWDDLSTHFQYQLGLPERARSEVTGVPNNEYLKFKNESLVKLIRDHDNSTTEVFKFINEHLKHSKFVFSCTSTFHQAPLHIAVQRGHLAITQLLLNLNTSEEFKQLKYLAHCCVQGSNSELIDQKVEIIEELSRRNRNLINEVIDQGTTPILQSNVHVTLLECLIRCGADVNAVDKSGCLVHRLATRLSPKEFHSFIEFLTNRGFTCFNTPDTQHRSPLHVAVQNIELLPETIELFQSKGACFNASDISGDSVLLYAVRGGRSFSLLQKLVDLGADIKHLNLNNEGLLHVCEKSNQNSLEDFLEKHGIAPFIHMTFEKRLLLHIIHTLANKKIIIGEKSSSVLLKDLLCCNKIMSWELDSNFITAADYLIQQGGVINMNGSPWELDAVKRNMQRTVDSTYCTVDLLGELEKRLVFVESLVGRSSALYAELQERESSFAPLCVSLLACNQLKPFIMLKQFLQSGLQEYLMFITPPNGLLEFAQSKDDKLIVLRTFDSELTIKRINDTVDAHAVVVSNESVSLDDQNLSIFQCHTVTNKVLKALSTNHKTIVVCEILSDGIETSVQDEVAWEDFSTNFQQDLISFMQKGHKYSLSHVSSLKNALLVEFINETIPEFIGVHKEGEQTSKLLSPTIFDYFLPDKLVFMDINLSELKEFAKLGQKIGDSLDSDYFIIHDESQFEHICRQDCNVHLIKYQMGQFKLLKTKGVEVEIQRFVKNNAHQRCEYAPFCTCGNHPIGDYNLVWDVYRFRSSNSSYWVNTLDMLEASKSNHDNLFDLLRSDELRDSLKVSFQQSGRFDFLKNIKNPKLRKNPLECLEIVKGLLKFIGCDGSDARKLKQIAVNTIFTQFARDSEIGGLDKFVQAGILVTNKSLVFVHEIVVWYFIAELVLEQHSSNMNVAEIRSMVLHDCVKPLNVELSFKWWEGSRYSSTEIKSYEFVNKQLFQFIDALVVGKDFPSHFMNTNEWIHTCVVSNHFNLLKVIMSRGVDPKVFETHDLLLLAIKYSELRVIELIMGYYDKIHKPKHDQEIEVTLTRDTTAHEYVISILHVGALRGDYSIMNYLINARGFEVLLSQPQMIDIIHFCVVSTQNCVNISERKRIIDLILLHATLIQETNQQQYTPVLVPNIHVNLIIRLINLGINAHARDSDSQNILHICPKYMTNLEYDKLVSVLFNKGLDIFSSLDNENCTPLFRALEHLEPLDSTFEVFCLAKVDFNAVKNSNNSVLIYAAKHNRSARVLSSLISAGADINMRGQFNRTVLHAAAETGNLSALAYLLSLNVNVDSVDDFKSTPLHLALHLSIKHTHEIVVLLVQHGASVNVRNKFKFTPLSYAIATTRVPLIEQRTIQFLKDNGAK